MGVRKRILVVDDEPAVLFVLHDTLLELGSEYEIVAADNGSEALDYARQSPFDLVITDLSMPDMGGIQFTEAIQAQCPNIPVIWLTAYGSYNVSADARRLNVYSCRDKPLEISEILDLAREALGANNGKSAH
jgi:two-component system response regulator AtoC